MRLRLFGYDVAVRKAAPQTLSAVDDSRGWTTIFDGTGGWFQQDYHPPSTETVLAYHAVYACITLPSADIGKLRPKLMVQDAGTGIWSETTNASFSPVLRKPNDFQNHIQFKEWWLTSKLMRGNAYVLLSRDRRGVVTAMYLMDPTRVTPLVSPRGEVFYRLSQDNLAGIEDQIVVPASEIIHDRMNCLFHPLVGTSPIFACAMAADHGLRIQRDSAKFFSNASMPGGVLTAPGEIKDEQAKRYKTRWKEQFTGSNSGEIAVLGAGLKFEPLRMTAVDSQLIEQLKLTAEIVCSAFHVPTFMVGVGTEPTYANGEQRSQLYYSQCLQAHIEAMELCLDEGLGLDSPKGGGRYGVELDLDGLLRMDSKTLMDTLKVGVDGAIYAPNEARRRLNMPPVKGGSDPLAQQQQFSLAALAERDADKPFAKPSSPTAAGSPTGAAANDDEAAAAAARAFLAQITKGLAECAT